MKNTIQTYKYAYLLVEQSNKFYIFCELKIKFSLL